MCLLLATCFFASGFSKLDVNLNLEYIFLQVLVPLCSEPCLYALKLKVVLYGRFIIGIFLIISFFVALELLEAQAATGSLLDPITGERYDVKGALQRELIDATQRDAMERAMRAVTGYRDPVNGQTLSLFEVRVG